LEAIEGIGPIVAKSIANFFGQAKNRNSVAALLNSGVQIKIESAKKTGALDGKVFVLTGTLKRLTRSQAKDLIQSAGGKISGSVSRNTDYVVAGESPGSKLTKAKELGVEVIDEAAFKDLLG
jgi:DNA ligase (NAD+)